MESCWSSWVEETFDWDNFYTFSLDTSGQQAPFPFYFYNSSTNVPMGLDDNKILGGSIFHGRSKICKGRLLSVLSGTIRSPNLDLGAGNLFLENKMFRVKSSFAEICLYFCLICYQRMIWYLCNICIKRYYWWSSVLNKRHWGKDLLDGGSGENTGEEAFDLLPSSNFQQCSFLEFFHTPTPN